MIHSLGTKNVVIFEQVPYRLMSWCCWRKSSGDRMTRIVFCGIFNDDLTSCLLKCHSFEPDLNQRPKDTFFSLYSPPLYQLSYRRDKSAFHRRQIDRTFCTMHAHQWRVHSQLLGGLYVLSAHQGAVVGVKHSRVERCSNYDRPPKLQQ